MKNITITVPDKVAKWARIWAARNNGSVSRLVGELLTQRMEEETAYRASMKAFLNQAATRISEDSPRYPERDSLYDR